MTSVPDPDAAERESGRVRRRPILLGSLHGLTALFLWTPVAALLWPARPYPLDLAANLGAHIGVALLALGGIGLLLKGTRRLGVGGVIAGLVTLSIAFVQSSDGAPFTQPPDDAAEIRVLTFNARMSPLGSDAGFMAWVRDRDPDLICVIEPPPGLFSRVHPLRTTHPHAILPERGRWWPIVLLSRHPVAPAGLERTEERRFSFLANRCVRVDLPGGAIRFGAMHPPSPRTPGAWAANLERTRRDARVAATLVEADEPPLIVAADMNSTPLGRGHRLFAHESGLATWSAPFSHGTWPAALPPRLSLSIDRVWFDPRLSLVDVEIGPSTGSDHRPLLATLVRAGGE